jgi:hypothetical protein
LALPSAAAPASPNGQQPAQPTNAGKNDDPNRIICEKVQETGSRLNTRKTCMTAAQWVEQRRRDREAVEEAQRQRTEPSGR